MKKIIVKPRRNEKKGGVNVTQGLFTPDFKKTTLRWSFTGGAATSASYGENVFSGNGLFDPGLTVTSSQPVGFDQYALWYNRYRVSGSKISLQFQLFSNSATPTATAVGARLVLYPSNTLAAASSYGEAIAQPRALKFEVGPYTPCKITDVLTSVKALGFNGSKVDSTDSAGVGAQPTAQWYWHLGFTSGAYTNMEYLVILTIDYAAEFYYRVTQPLSLLEKLQKEMNLAIKEEIKRREDLPPQPLLKPVLTDFLETKVFSVPDHTNDNLTEFAPTGPVKLETKEQFTTSVVSAKPTKFLDNDLSKHYTMVNRDKNVPYLKSLTGKNS